MAKGGASMVDHSIVRTDPIPFAEDISQLDEVRDEVFLDLQGSQDTQFLTIGCYEQAVRECVPMGDDCFLLKVRDELRGLLVCQLHQEHRPYRVYRPTQRPDQRLLIGDDVRIQFYPESSMAERRAVLSDYVSGLERIAKVSNGRYRLIRDLRDNPLTAIRALREQKAIEEVHPYVYPFPAWALQEL
jgi:hypothetical protein